MVLTTAAATRDGAFLRFATSTAHADAPLDADRVRLEVRGSGYLIEPRGAAVKRDARVLRRARGRARVPREPARVAADGDGAQGAGACFGGFFE